MEPMITSADILLLEDDIEYANIVRNDFTTRTSPYELRVHHAADIDSALHICRRQDVRVAIIDLLLPNGDIGTDAISRIWQFDKKIIFVIHSVHPPHSIAEWSTRLGVPYSSQFYLQKIGGVEDVARLYDLTLKALHCYVPHAAAPLTSVREVVEIVGRFSESHPSFRNKAILSAIHYSQDIMNAVSLWAADRLARPGFDSMLLSVFMTGSFARLEASARSDADYFLLFDDTAVNADRLQELMELAYSVFLDVAPWFEKNGVPVHDTNDDRKHPQNIEWHSTTLPTWFPLSTLLKKPLGRTTQLELTKHWLLLESRPIFNGDLAEKIRTAVSANLGIISQKTVRDAIAHSAISETLTLLSGEFDYAYRHRERNALKTVKHYFMRLVHLFSLRLWLLRCFLDPQIFEAVPEHLLAELSPLPVVRIMEFREFMQRVPALRGKPLTQCLLNLDKIINLYGDVAHAFGSMALRATESADADRSLVNDLSDAANICGECIAAVNKLLRDSTYIAGYPDLAARQIV